MRASTVERVIVAACLVAVGLLAGSAQAAAVVGMVVAIPQSFFDEYDGRAGEADKPLDEELQLQNQALEDVQLVNKTLEEVNREICATIIHWVGQIDQLGLHMRESLQVKLIRKVEDKGGILKKCCTGAVCTRCICSVTQYVRNCNRAESDTFTSWAEWAKWRT